MSIRGLMTRCTAAQLGGKNPFAGMAGVRPTLPVCLMRGINESAQTRELKVGELITYMKQHTGWGSDPGQEEWFRTEDGFEGAFDPAGMWGGVNAVLLE